MSNSFLNILFRMFHILSGFKEYIDFVNNHLLLSKNTELFPLKRNCLFNRNGYLRLHRFRIRARSHRDNCYLWIIYQMVKIPLEI